MTNSSRIALVAGEPSGDQLGAHLIAALKARLPDAQFFGIAGPKMVGAGADAWWPAEKLAVRGYIEVLRHYREISGIRRALIARLKSDPPDVFIGIDAPDFNLGVETALKKRGIPTIHYVSPSLWAWRPRRIRRMNAAVNHVLALFPFEPAIYQRANIPVTYVGHPLADEIPLPSQRLAARERLDIAPTKRVIALLPGSRESEVERMAELFISTAQRLIERFPDVQFLAPLITRKTRDLFETALWQLKAQKLPIKMIFGHAHDVLAAADVALIASGTATLEALLLKTPHVITYRMASASWHIMRRMRLQPWVGLPNILAKRFVAPEFLQDQATPENLSQALGNLLLDKAACADLVQTFTTIHEELRQNTAEKAATAVIACLTRP